MQRKEDLVVFLITEILRIFIIEKYAEIFMSRKSNSVLIFIPLLGSFALTTSTYLFFPNVLANMVATLLGILIISTIFEGNIYKKIMLSSIVFMICCAADVLAAFLFSTQPNVANYDFFASLMSVFLFLFSLISTEKVYKKDKLGADSDFLTKYWWYMIAIILSAMCVLYVLAVDFVVSRTATLIISFFFLVYSFVIYILYNSLIEAHVKALDNEKLLRQMEAYEEQLKLQMENQKRLHSLKHDMKHHLFELEALAARGNYESIIEYINNMQDYVQVQNNKVQTGNNAIDSIINHMIKVAEGKSISVEVKVEIPKDMEIPSFDMNILLGNLMENAIEASQKTDEKWIKLHVRYSQNCLFIYIANSFDGKFKKEGNIYRSIKDDGGHGYGLYGIQSVVDKYKGEIKISHTDKIFSVELFIYYFRQNKY